MGLVKGIKNVFGRKARKQRKARKRLDHLRDELDDPLKDHLWTSNPLASADQPTARVNPLYNTTVPEPIASEEVEPNEFSSLARTKRDTTGKGLGKLRLKDRHIGRMNNESDDMSDSAHEVKRVDYQREIGDTGTNEGFFKPADEQHYHGSVTAEESGIGEFDMSTSTKITGEGALATVAPKLIARSVASTRLDQRLGLDTIAHEFEAKHDGRRGVVSGKTNGLALGDNRDKVDLSNPETQKGLANLQFFDYLSNQQDRHANNIFVDPDTGKVTGIDNDLSWGKKHTEKTGMMARNMGLPEQVSREMYDSFMGMSEDDFIKTMAGDKGDYQRLGPEEIQAARERYQTMKRYLEGEEIEGRTATIVDEFGQDTHQAQMDGIQRKDDKGEDINYGFQSKQQKHLKSYLQRESV